MKKADIKPGVVYTYRQHVSNELVPVVFLSGSSQIGALYQENRRDARAFRHAPDAHRVRAGTVYNDGTIGYPAVLLHDSKPSADDMALLCGITITDFRRATASWDSERGLNFILVTSMARVVGQWEDVTE